LGNANLAFLRDFSEFYHGIPSVDWLRSVMDRLDPDLFRALLVVLGRSLLAGQARSCGDRRQDLAPQPQSKDRPDQLAGGEQRARLLRCDFTGIVLSTLRTCHVSDSSTASPAWRIAV
jgi:hypothetical protein